VTYPAQLQLIAAMNPCRCGWDGDPVRVCRCPPREPERYRRRVSGPLLDRLDLRVVMPRLDPGQIVRLDQPESSLAVAQRILEAWKHALERNGGMPNAALRGQGLLRACALDAQARHDLQDLAHQLELTARGVHRTLRVARTIADLRGRTVVGTEELAAAAALRDRSFEQAAAA
jgi:magnesium chelatase family protein